MFVPAGRTTRLYLHSDRITRHDGGHAKYNKYVHDLLEAGHDPNQIVSHLRQGVRRNTVPWK